MQEVATIPESAVPDALTAPAIVAQVALIQNVMKTVMVQGEHYGVIPGTGTKPSLLKPGAEKLLLTFRLDPQYESTERFVGEHCFIKSKCTLYHITTGRRMGSGEGSCSTKESKYAYRQGKRLCPECGKEAIIKGKAEYGGGWLCFKKKDGCGAKWPDGAKEIEAQNVERVPNEDVADQYNTILKMANKRSLVAAVLNVTAASDIFTQDVEDNTPPIDAAAPRGGKTSQEEGLANDHVKSGGHTAQRAKPEPPDSVEQHTEPQGDIVVPGASLGYAPVAWREMIALSETVKEASDTGNRIEKDETLDLLTKTQLREEVKQRILSLRAKKG